MIPSTPARQWKPYPAYKPSGVEWLGIIPAHWEVKRLKYVAPICDERAHAVEPEARYIGLEHIESATGRLGESASDGSQNGMATEGTAGVFRTGDVLFGKLRPYLSKVLEASFGGVCSTELLVMRPTPEITSRFLAYTLLSKEFIAWVDSMTYGTKMPRASPAQITNTEAPLPPVTEQGALAAFLDRETAKIDALVAKKERLIALLQEKRAALITHAVTRGLNPSASMKDSGGVEWLGEIPAHWEAKRLPFVVSVQEGPGIMASDFLEDGVPLLRIGNLTQGSVTLDGCNFLSPEKVESRWRHFRLEEGDLLISGSASTGQVSFVDSAASGSIAYTGIFRLRPVGGNVLKEFVAYFVGSAAFLDQVNTLRTGVGIQHYGPKHLRSVWVPLPPFPEQLSIREVLDVETGKIDALIARLRKGIERLKEYRATVISAAVTGKIDVRGEMA